LQVYVKGNKQLTNEEIDGVLDEIGFGGKITKRRLSNAGERPVASSTDSTPTEATPADAPKKDL